MSPGPPKSGKIQFVELYWIPCRSRVVMNQGRRARCPEFRETSWASEEDRTVAVQPRATMREQSDVVGAILSNERRIGVLGNARRRRSHCYQKHRCTWWLHREESWARCARHCGNDKESTLYAIKRRVITLREARTHRGRRGTPTCVVHVSP